MFSGCDMLPDIKETKLGSRDQEASPSAGKNTGVILVPCCAWKCAPTVIPVKTDQFSVRVTKITLRICVL